MTKPRRDPAPGTSWADEKVREARRLHPEIDWPPLQNVADLRLDEFDQLIVPDEAEDEPDVHLRKQADRHDERRHR